MKADEVKGMAKEIFSDGKETHSSKHEEPDQDDMGDVESMNIERAGNGYMVSTSHKQKPGKGNNPEPYVSPTKSVFTNHADVAAHVSKVFGKGK